MMSTSDGRRDGSGPGDESRAGHAAPPAPNGGLTWFGRARWMGLAAGLVAGLIAFGMGEETFDWVPAEKIKLELQGSIIWETDRKTTIVADSKNGSVAFAELGLALGACLGIAGGLGRRSVPGALKGGLVGAFLGLALGGGLSWVALPRFINARYTYFDYDLLISLAMHGLLWGMLGGVAGLAFAVGLGPKRGWSIGQAIAYGFLGALLGSLIFDLIGAVVSDPTAGTDRAISLTWQTRLLARMLVASGAAIGIVLGLPGRRSSPRESAGAAPSSVETTS